MQNVPILHSHQIQRKYKVYYIDSNNKNCDRIFNFADTESCFKYFEKYPGCKITSIDEITTPDELKKEIERIKPFVELNEQLVLREEQFLREEESKYRTLAFKKKILTYNVLIYGSLLTFVSSIIIQILI